MPLLADIAHENLSKRGRPAHQKVPPRARGCRNAPLAAIIRVLLFRGMRPAPVAYNPIFATLVASTFRQIFSANNLCLNKRLRLFRDGRLAETRYLANSFSDSFAYGLSGGHVLSKITPSTASRPAPRPYFRWCSSRYRSHLSITATAFLHMQISSISVGICQRFRRA